MPGEQNLQLTQKEFILLLVLVRCTGRLAEPEELFRNVWGTASAEDHSALHTTISQLNRKLDAAGTMLRIAFRRGEGYEPEDI